MKIIGMRNIKTAISVFICVILMKLFKLEFPFYACIAAIITMQNSVHDSFKAGKNRFIGTSIGAFVGLLFALITPGNAILIALGISLIIYLCNIFYYNQAITIACIVFISIMTNLKTSTPFTYSLHRLLETFIGITVALLVNYFIKPPKYLDDLCSYNDRLIHTIISLSSTKFYKYSEEDIEKLNSNIDAFKNLIEKYINEFKGIQSERINLNKMNKVLFLCERASNHLSLLLIIRKDLYLTGDLNNNYNSNSHNNNNNYISLPYITKDYFQHNKALKEDSKELYIVFNYHLNELLELTKELSKNSC